MTELPAAYSVVATRIVGGQRWRETRSLTVDGVEVGRSVSGGRGDGTAELDGGHWTLQRGRRAHKLRGPISALILDAATGLPVVTVDVSKSGLELSVQGLQVLAASSLMGRTWTASSEGVALATYRIGGLIASTLIIDVSPAGAEAIDPRLLVIGLLHGVDCWRRANSSAD